MVKLGVSRRQYALSRNVSEASIRKHIANGTLAGAVLSDGSLDPDAADELLASSRVRGPKVAIQVSAAKARRQRAQIRLLQDESYRLRRSVVTTDDAKERMSKSHNEVKEWLRSIPGKAAAEAAGLSAKRAHIALQNCIYQALTDMHESSAHPERPKVSASVEPDIAGMTPTELTALQLNLQAERLELERALNLGLLLWVEDVADEYVEKLSIIKASLLAIPARVAVFMEASTREEARALIADEIELAVKVLE